MTNSNPVKPVTLKMVAKVAKVSESAVCHILKGRARALGISVACEKRVQAAALRLGYLGNYHARALAKQGTRSIGLTITNGGNPFLDNAYWGSLVAGIELESRMQSYEMHTIGGRFGEDIVSEAFNQLQAQRINGLILFPFLYPELPEAVLRPGLPIVFIVGRDLPKVSSVSLDPTPGLDAALQHLHQLGHRQILYIGHSKDSGKLYLERINHLRDGARRMGMHFGERYLHLVPLPYNPTRNDSLTEQVRNLAAQIQSFAPATALMCANDEMAMMMIKILADRGIQVPTQMSVIGFDDITAGHHLPGITTISHRLLAMGRLAVELLIEILAGKHGKRPVTVRVPSELVIRETTSICRA